MNEESRLVSKVLVLENAGDCLERIKQFCDEQGLIGLRAPAANVMGILHTHVDLGAILLAEDYVGDCRHSVDLAGQIRAARPELPIVLLRKTLSGLEDLPPKQAKLFCGSFAIDDMQPLRRVIDEYIFSLVYPNVLVRGIAEISVNALSSQFPGFSVSNEAPYIVRDRIIYGQVFSLIPLESRWCRGYMMLQTEEQALMDMVTKQAPPNAAAPTFRQVNNLLGEVTNLIWGAFKNRFIADDDRGSVFTAQVPIVVNHQNNYISFGSENPHLCFKYTLADDNESRTTTFYQWFVFNLNWSPEDFSENQASLDELVDTGELELF